MNKIIKFSLKFRQKLCIGLSPFVIFISSFIPKSLFIIWFSERPKLEFIHICLEPGQVNAFDIDAWII